MKTARIGIPPRVFIPHSDYQEDAIIAPGRVITTSLSYLKVIKPSLLAEDDDHIGIKQLLD